MLKSTPAPTDAEFQVLRVLWRFGPATVRRVHEDLYRGSEVGYTTTLKLLQNMLGKGLVKRDEHPRQHIYSAAVTEQNTLNRIVRRWIDNTFGGSSVALAMQALAAKSISVQELESLKKMISRFERKEHERK